MSMKRVAYSSAILGLLSTLGCAGAPWTRPKMITWDQAKQESKQARQIKKQKKKQRPTKQAAPTSAPSNQMGPNIDRSLAHFVAQRATIAGTGRIPPPNTLKQWDQTLDQLDSILAKRPTPEDLGGLVRARVTLEVEMERDQERFGEVPYEITVAYVQILEKIDRRVRDLRAATDPIDLTHRMPSDNGELVLHWPLGTFRPTSPFGYRRDPINGKLRFHSGLDLSAPPSTTIHAAAPGVVLFAAYSGGYGNYVVMQHANGVRTHYAHLAHLFVEAGDQLTQRAPLGTVGSTGRATGPHLHYAISMSGNFVDPTLYTNTKISADGSIPDS